LKNAARESGTGKGWGKWATSIKADVIALWLAARERRTPWYANAVAAVVAAYVLSPLNLVPDFVPVLGYLDDLIVVPIGIMIAIRSMLPG
jgi:uncharacterized membrane protein YkvA (DUF1232 family)